jgi:gas vesicle protein
MSEKAITAALGLRSLEEVKTETEDQIESLPVVQETKTTELSNLEAIAAADETLQDIEKARNNIQQIIELGDDSLQELVSLAKQSESPRAFEVVSGMMKTLLDANREFVEMSTRKKYAKEEILKPKEDEQSAVTNVTNNNLILSTADLLKMIKGESS